MGSSIQSGHILHAAAQKSEPPAVAGGLSLGFVSLDEWRSTARYRRRF
jgi:hypothetical protein